MRKNLFLCLVMLFALKANSQVLYLETFDNISGPTAGGPGTYTFPTNMLLRNVDNLTPAPSVNYVTSSWIRREDFSFNVADSCAFSTSWYAPNGTANDFMWTPAIALPNTGTSMLTWNAVAYDPLYQDGYEVRIMTTAPTGGSGVIGNQLSSSTAIFSTAAENSTWTSRSVNISSYAGQTVYIGFRNNTFDKFLLLIDDIKVENLNPFDATVTTGVNSEYTMIPVDQASIPLGGIVTNVGSNTLTNVALTASIYNSLSVLVHSATSSTVPTMAPSGNASFSIPSWTPTVADNYTIKYNHVQTETDGNASNDELSKTIMITNSTYARDDATAVGGLGIGAGNGGYIGQSFTLNTPAYLYSIRAFYTRGYIGKPHACVLWNTNGSGVPTTILASSDTMNYPDDNALDVTYPIYGGNMLLPAGNYVVTACEFDSTVQLANTTNIFTAGKGWVNWPTIPTGTWANIETFGGAFAKPFIIRLNLGATLFPLPSEALILKGESNTTAHKLTWTNQEKTNQAYHYSLQRSDDLKTWKDIHELTTVGADKLNSYSYQDAKGFGQKSHYRIQVTTKDNEMKYSNMISLFNSNDNVLVDVFPNPAKDVVNINTNSLKKATFSLFDIQGKLVLTQELTETNAQVSLQGLSSGVYQMKITTSNEVIFQDKLSIK